MHRFSVLYIYHKQYHQLLFATRSEAEAALKKFPRPYKGTPTGIYDAKTELFFWEQSRRQKQSRLSFALQAQEESKMIATVQHLRRKASAPREEEVSELDILMRPMPIS